MPLREIAYPVVKAEVLGCDQEILQGTPQADVKLPILRICQGLPAPLKISEELHLVSVDYEVPGLAVLGRRREDGIAKQELELLLDRGLPGKLLPRHIPHVIPWSEHTRAPHSARTAS